MILYQPLNAKRTLYQIMIMTMTVIIKTADSKDTAINSCSNEVCKGLLSCIYSILIPLNAVLIVNRLMNGAGLPPALPLYFALPHCAAGKPLF
jgi:hypothetical protein